MFGCLAFCEPDGAVPRDPQLWVLALYTLGTGAIGMCLARRRPILSALFSSFVLLSAFAVYLEVRDSHAGDSALRMSGYISGSALAILAGIGMSVLGALVGAKKVEDGARTWRWTSGGSGTVLLGLTVYAIAEFARNVYSEYSYYLRIGANHYVLSWQDILAKLPMVCILFALLFFASYLLGSAIWPEKAGRIAVTS